MGGLLIGLNALHVRSQRGGVGHYAAGLVEGLLALPEFEERGHRLVLFATPDAAPLYERDHPRFELVPWGRPGEGLLGRRLREWTRLQGEIARRGVNVWHGVSNFLPMAKPAGTAYVLTLHDVSYWLFPQRVGLAKRLYWKAWTRRSLALADEFITASRHSRSTICQTLGLSPSQFAIIPHAAAERFRPDPTLASAVDALWSGDAPVPDSPAVPDSAPAWERLAPGSYLLSICTLEPGKNLPGLVRAFARLKRQRGDDARVRGLKLALAGGAGWKNAELFREIEAAGLREEVALLGYVPDEALPRLLAGSAAFAFFSLNEGFGLPPLEAMQSGVPVACSDASSLPEVVGDAAILADPHSVASMSAALERVLFDAAERSRLREAGPLRAARFSWERTARETLAVYERA
jgi:glycosyltransferase involved in cell wall biosynthesis